MAIANLVSLRGKSLANFVTTEDFTPHPYWDALQGAKIREKTLFINGSPKSDKAKRMKKLAECAVKNGLAVFMNTQWQEALGDCEGICFLERKTTEFYRALVEAAFVYTESSIHHYYAKTEGQVLVVDMSLTNDTDVGTWAVYDNLSNKADYILSREKDGGKSVLGKLQKGTLMPCAQKDKRKKLLFLMNMSQSPELFRYFRAYTQQLNFEQYDVTVMVRDSHLKKYSYSLSQLDKRIHLITKKGDPLCSVEQARRYLFVRKEDAYLTDLEAVDHFLSPELFSYEAKRLFGDTCFDYVFNCKFDTINWDLVLHHVSGMKSAVCTEPLTSKMSKGYLKRLAAYDELLFFNVDAKNASVSVLNDKLRKGSRVLPKLRAETDFGGADSIVLLNGERYVMYSVTNDEGTDRLSIQYAKVPADGTPYVVLRPESEQTEVLPQLKEYLSKYPQLVIFDECAVLSSDDVQELKQAGEVYHYSSLDLFGAIKQLLGKKLVLKKKLSFFAPKNMPSTLEQLISSSKIMK